MTNQQGAPEALFYADALDRCAEVDFDHIFVPAAAVIRRLHAENERLAALVEAQQPAPSAAAAEIVELLECSGCLKVGQKDRALAIVARLLPAQHGGVL